MRKDRIPKPQFFIVGAPKCGTTALWHWLRQHPQIYLPEKKELHYFGQDLDMYHSSLEEYLDWFKNAREDQIIGEASTSYFYSETAPYEILEFVEGAKVIIALRNPVDMVYSLHAQLVFSGEEPIKDFRKALIEEPLRKKGCGLPKYRKAPTIYFLYTEVGKFSLYIRRYLAAFGERAYIVLYDDIKTRAHVVYREILEFLGVDNTFTPQFSVMNPYKRPRSYILSRFMGLFPLTPVGNMFKKIIPKEVRSRIATKLWNLNSKYAEKPPMDPHLRRELTERFRDDIIELEKIIKRDLSAWLVDKK